jgi:hypothetical protein
MSKGADTVTFESNTLASRNGKAIEKSIALYMGVPLDGQPVDAVLDGKPLEIKSCQQYITDVGSHKSRRSGRFVFNEEQHKYLLQNNGIYALVVRMGDIVIHTRLIKANLISGISGRASVKPWPGVIH